MVRRFIFLCLLATLTTGLCPGQSFVTTGGQKYTLIEEATGAWCQNCPDGAQWLQEKIEPDYPRVIVASFHDDHGGDAAADAMTMPGNPFNSGLPNGTGYITAFPLGCVDRVPLGGKAGLNCAQWYGATGSRNAIAPSFDVTMTSVYDPATRVVQIRLMAKALTTGTGTWRVNAYITEDSIASDGPGYAQVSIFTSPTAMSGTGSLSWYAGHGNPIAPSTLYAHMNVVRAVLPGNADNIWGDADVVFTDPHTGDSVVANYTYTIPDAYSDKHMKVIGLVQKYGTFTSDRTIENCISARVKDMSKDRLDAGIAAKAETGLTISPNPAGNNIYIQYKFSTLPITPIQLTITDAKGQAVYRKEKSASTNIFFEEIPLEILSNGVYFMWVTGNNMKATGQFTIQK